MVKLNQKIKITLCIICLFVFVLVVTGQPAQPVQKRIVTVIHPEWVFDGMEIYRGKSLAIVDSLIMAVVAPEEILKTLMPTDTVIYRDLPGKTLCPGFIEGHAHILLHPYNETSWDDQVLKESRAKWKCSGNNSFRLEHREIAQ